MARYKSRVTKGAGLTTAAKKKVAKKVAKKVGARVKKVVAKRAAAAVQPTEDIPPPPPAPVDPVGGALSTGGAITADPTLDSIGGALSTGGQLSTGGALSTGGQLSTGGALPADSVSLQGFVDNMSYPEMIHTIGHMDSDDYHSLQGIAAAHLPNVRHPLKVPMMTALGGSFDHPQGVSKVATKDIVLAPTQRHLAGMLHSEMIDQQGGRDVGGGLFDSIKNVVKKGVSGLARGAKAALGIGKKLRGALSKGVSIAKSFEKPISAAFPAAGQLLQRGISAGQALETGIGVGLAAGEKISSGLQGLSSAVNPQAAAEAS